VARSRQRRWIVACGLAVSLLPFGGRAEDPQPAPPAPDWGRVSLSSGVDYSSGSYGETDKTQIWYVPLSVRYERGAWEGRLTVPYLRVTGPGALVAASTSQSSAVTPIPSRHAGLGDVVASGSYFIDPPYPGLPLRADREGEVPDGES
jgi:hypothetical protein